MPKYERFVFTFRSKKPNESYRLYQANVTEAFVKATWDYCDKMRKLNSLKLDPKRLPK